MLAIILMNTNKKIYLKSILQTPETKTELTPYLVKYLNSFLGLYFSKQ